MVLGALSFVMPATWRVVDRVARPRGRAPTASREATSQSAAQAAEVVPAGRSAATQAGPLRWFRLILFLTFSGLSLAATRNSHQFAAVVGTVTAWNLAEWAAEVAARLRRRAPRRPHRPPRIWPRVATSACWSLAIVAVGSGRFYAWSAEGRTIGLGEEPLWFPHAAPKFAGRRDARPPGRVPQRPPVALRVLLGPGKQVYTDARLEVMGPDLYQEYMTLRVEDQPATRGLDRRPRQAEPPGGPARHRGPRRTGGWWHAAEARRWHCVWFDPIAAVFVDDSTRHHPGARGRLPPLGTMPGRARGRRRRPRQPALATARSLRRRRDGVSGPRGRRQGAALDLARRSTTPGGSAPSTRRPGRLEAGGSAELPPRPLPGEPPIPRFRLPFDPTIDLHPVTAPYQLRQALPIAPDEGVCLFYLSLLDTMRGMDESAIPLLDRVRPAAEQEPRTAAAEGPRARSGWPRSAAGSAPEPATKWANLSELEQVYDRLDQVGPGGDCRRRDRRRAPRRRPPVGLGRPTRDDPPPPRPARPRPRRLADRRGRPPALQAARVAATYLVEGDLEAARRAYGAGAGERPEPVRGPRSVWPGSSKGPAAPPRRSAAARPPSGRAHRSLRQSGPRDRSPRRRLIPGGTGAGDGAGSALTGDRAAECAVALFPPVPELGAGRVVAPEPGGGRVELGDPLVAGGRRGGSQQRRQPLVGAGLVRPPRGVAAGAARRPGP